MTGLSHQEHYPSPRSLRLRALAFDPVLSREIETSEINDVVIKIPWNDDLQIGPVDEYLEVVDYDPASRVFYAPVNLMDPALLAQDGLPPEEGNPQFHQQMVYAIARTTIGHFESALGRPILWSVRLTKEEGTYHKEYVGRLRIYPHAFRAANAYYDPEKKALLFGYFPASKTVGGNTMPGETVFACISHDIVAHETTHAIIDGLHPRFIEPSNIDVLALHEALADIIALFQHFTYPEVLKHQISRTRGQLEQQNLLGELAYQFGQAIGQYGALRSAIGEMDPSTGEWRSHTPDPEKILTTTESHARGALFVAALFDAFLLIYKSRIRDLLRIASGGTGILPAGEIHPDLANRLANEAAKTAGHLLRMSIRALDYCPPVDPTCGDFLRALITADRDLVADDRHHYRTAIIEAFRRWGIYPLDVRNLSAESLVWHVPDDEEQAKFTQLFGGPTGIRQLVPDWDMRADRQEIHEQLRKSRAELHERVMSPAGRTAAAAAHIVLDDPLPSIYCTDDGVPAVEIHSVRPTRRLGPDGQALTELVIEMTQRRRGYLNADDQKKVDEGLIDPPEPDFIMRGGCTLLVDPSTGQVRYCVYKNITSENRLNRMRVLLREGVTPSLYVTYFGNPYLEHYRNIIRGSSPDTSGVELFRILHQPCECQEED